MPGAHAADETHQVDALRGRLVDQPLGIHVGADEQPDTADALDRQHRRPIPGVDHDSEPIFRALILR